MALAAVRLVATGDLAIGAVSETHDAHSTSNTRRSGFLSTESGTRRSSERSELAVGLVDLGRQRQRGRGGAT